MKCRPILALVLAASPLVSLRAQHADDSASAPLRFTTGVTAGALRFPDGRMQQGASAVVRWHPSASVSLGATPTFTRLIPPSSIGSGSITGLSDLPIELTVDHALHVPMSPTVGASVVATIPLGDTASGLGSGSLGSSVSLGVGLSPSERLAMHVGAGRPLSDYSLDGALGGSKSGWGEAEASYNLSDRLDASLGVDADFSADSGAAPARTFVAGLSFAVHGPLTLTVNGAHGVSGAAARWSLALGLGTDFASIEALGSTSRVRRAVAALGGHSQNHGRGQSSGHGRP